MVTTSNDLRIHCDKYQFTVFVWCALLSSDIASVWSNDEDFQEDLFWRTALIQKIPHPIENEDKCPSLKKTEMH